jgi:hypothetical protein
MNVYYFFHFVSYSFYSKCIPHPSIFTEAHTIINIAQGFTCRYIFKAMYNIVLPFHEAKFCGVLSRIFDKFGCAAGKKHWRETAVFAAAFNWNCEIIFMLNDTNPYFCCLRKYWCNCCGACLWGWKESGSVYYQKQKWLGPRLCLLLKGNIRLFFLVGRDSFQLVLQPLLAYYTSPRW